MGKFDQLVFKNVFNELVKLSYVGDEKYQFINFYSKDTGVLSEHLISSFLEEKKWKPIKTSHTFCQICNKPPAYFYLQV